ncbi:hypothetical protein DV737_g1079, partial [Chaetothyriales sp. CBS 132003]
LPVPSLVRSDLSPTSQTSPTSHAAAEGACSSTCTLSKTAIRSSEQHSLLALSNTAVALADTSDVEPDDDRDDDRDDEGSSSLSELDEDGGDDDFDQEHEEQEQAETERLEESPEKALRKRPFGTATPSKLAQTSRADERPEIESLTESAMSSPISSHSDSDELSDAPVHDDESGEDESETRSPAKRKREAAEELGAEEQARTRRRRTGSRAQKSTRSRSSRRRDKAVPAIDAVDDEAEDGGAEAGEESDEAEADDAEVAAKSEEEQASKVAAMESLQGLERHFAALRDRLYDERIAAINRELAQLAEPVPVHPELLKQLEVVKRWRDQKFEIEQKLLVYKIGALKNKSLAERSQIHSAYFQTVRDVREKHLERLSEHFYRIQRDRFKTAPAMASFTIPFPEKRSKQITQQTAYNKEVSVLSGIAKYVGFPAAPEIPSAHAAELEADLQKLGLSAQVRSSRPVARPSTTYSSGLVAGAAAADEHFLERNPWANPPQHPIHRLAQSRQHSNQSPMTDSYLTPAQQRTTDQPHIGGSASTIPEHPSQPASSAHNTPHDQPGSQQKLEAHAGINRLNSPSPLDTRRAAPTTAADYHPHQRQHHYNPPSQGQDSGRGGGADLPSSPLAARVAMVTSPPRPGHGLADGLAAHSNPSPSQRPPSIAACGYGG